MNSSLFLGTALANPIQLDTLTKPIIVTGERLIKEALQTLLLTQQGTRFMVPEYGSRLLELVYEQNDDVLENLARTFIYQAIEQFEKRIKFVDAVFFYPNEDVINIEIYYEILQSNQIDSFVFPFYREIKY